MPRVVHFEIHAADCAKAAKFYTDLFGWAITKWDGPMEYWLIKTGEDGTRGINGGLVQRRGPAPAEGQPVNSYMNTVDVPNLDEYLAKAQKLGATVALPKMPVPGVGWLAYIKDLDGNILGMMQSDPTAKM
jgi:predicted enzyme related to lactoylglutathione lyase